MQQEAVSFLFKVKLKGEFSMLQLRFALAAYGAKSLTPQTKLLVLVYAFKHFNIFI